MSVRCVGKVCVVIVCVDVGGGSDVRAGAHKKVVVGAKVMSAKVMWLWSWFVVMIG